MLAVLILIQVYMSWTNVSVPVPRLQLAGFTRISLKNGASQTLRFTIKGEQMAVWMDDNSGFGVPRGMMTVYAGGQQPNQSVNIGSNVLKASFLIQ